MSPDFVWLADRRTVGDAIADLRRTELPEESVTTVFTVDAEQRLSGVISVVALLKRDTGEPLSTAASQPPLVLETDDELSEIAPRMADYDLTIAPVVDERGTLVGIVSVDDLLEMMIPEDWRRRLNALSNE
jgi:Mg/Co/Ni transporter MgtE